MKNYEVYLINDDGSPMLQKDGSRIDDFSIKAESPKLAYEAFVKSIKPLPFAKVRVHWGLLGAKQFEPPHYEGHIAKKETREITNTITKEETREITNTITKEEKTPSHESSKGGGSRDAISSSTDQKLDKIYDVLNHIRWIGLGIGGMFALTFIVPQMCTGG